MCVWRGCLRIPRAWMGIVMHDHDGGCIEVPRLWLDPELLLS